VDHVPHLHVQNASQFDLRVVVFLKTKAKVERQNMFGVNSRVTTLFSTYPSVLHDQQFANHLPLLCSRPVQRVLSWPHATANYCRRRLGGQCQILYVD
jgi:hypothetical protein